jgi:hypothetical protein
MQIEENLIDITKEIKNESGQSECKDIGKVENANYIDFTIIGKKYKKLLVLSFNRKEGKNTFWNCLCDCGKTVVIKRSHFSINTRKNISCGCAQKKRPSGRLNKTFNDLTGKTFGNFKVKEFIGKVNNDRANFWKCECICGKEILLKTAIIINEIRESCGCIPHKKRALIKRDKIKNVKSLIGLKKNCLTIIELIGYKNEQPLWKTRCDCGNYSKITSSLFNSGVVKSCGCSKRKSNKHLIGKKIGSYTVIDEIYIFDKKRNTHVGHLKCKCNCGYIRNFRPDKLKDIKINFCNQCRDYYGENNGNYNPNLTDIERDNNRNINPQNKIWVKEVYKRDKYFCQVTKRRGLICAHHLESWHANENLRFDLNNGVTLLESVHRDFHKKFGLKNNTKLQFEEYVKNLSENNKINLYLENKKLKRKSKK